MGKLEERIETSQKTVKELADLVTKSYDDAIDSLKGKNKKKAKKVQEIWPTVFRLVFKVEEHALTGLVLHQPFGEKFRELAAAFKIATELERIGKYVIHIAEASEALVNAERSKNFDIILQMAEKTKDILDHSLTAFFEKDLGSIPPLSKIDDEIDSLYTNAFDQFAEEYKEKNAPVRFYGHIVLLIRSLERLADHACNIGSRVLFMIEGKRYRIY
ncbi:MAG: phosphate signaling complex protein PhoU [Candidatus Korarchaeota archaeon]|nr:phosphate signaling complex protein PhoU [Candidatus Korarchaeota archaeon]NIU83229.1 phosphate signaling complex protein PhoU [Candidatus Thorarchaeota archaeon]NIW13175.1 phosphate signaling complex protein PhoU [Candidatus Thorarchaeota archaeon]NIW51316.1 phosphate signaling complex protein PhoU [Candidatus Korarchaeota archaeon]